MKRKRHCVRLHFLAHTSRWVGFCFGGGGGRGGGVEWWDDLCGGNGSYALTKSYTSANTYTHRTNGRRICTLLALRMVEQLHKIMGWDDIGIALAR